MNKMHLTGSIHVNNAYITGTVPVNKMHLTHTVPVNKAYLTGTVPVNKVYLTGTLFLRYIAKHLKEARKYQSRQSIGTRFGGAWGVV